MITSARIASAAFLFGILVLGISASKAAVIYSYVAEPSAVVLDVGSTANVEIYLQETVTDSSNSLLAANGGLFNAGVSIITATESAASIALGSGDPAFAGPSLVNVTPSAASFLEGVSITDNTGPEGIADGNITLVPLASISVLANSIGQTTFDIGEYNALGGNTLDFAGDDLDFDNTSPAYVGAGDGVTTLTVTVPEPMTAAGSLLPIGILGLLRRRRRGLRNACRPTYGVDCLEKRLFLSGSPLNIPASFSAKPTFVEKGLVPRSAIKVGISSAINLSPAASTLAAPYTASQIRQAYGVNAISFFNTVGDGTGQTIAIIDAYNDPNILVDANFFSTNMGLQQFNVNGGPTLSVLNENGQTPLPTNASPGTWDVEESLDVEWVHAIAPKANIVLFEADSSDLSDLMAAVDTARNYPGVDVVNMSWGGSEFYGEQLFDSYFTTPTGHQGVTFVGSSGDTGGSPQFPETSPNVLGVAATSLTLNSNGTFASESAWPDSGGGVSYYQPQPAYQAGKVNNTSSANRTSPDVSIDGDPATGVLVWDSFYSSTYYLQVGGTSLAAPLWSGLVAIADQARTLMNQPSLDGATGTLPRLYQLPSSDFHDVTTGSNGFAATAGYDLATGLGSPIASQLVPALAGYAPASHLTFASEPPSSVTAGNTIPSLTVDVKDSSGNTVATDNSHVTFTVTGPNGVVTSNTTTISVQNGVATFSNLSPTQAGNYYITATDGTLSQAISNSFTVTPAAASKIAFYQQPSSIYMTGTMSPPVSVVVQDMYNNIVTSNTPTISLAVYTGPGSITGTTSAVAMNGFAIFSAISFQTPGNYMLRAMASDLPTVISTSFSVTGDKLVFTEEPSVNISGAILSPIQVSVEMPNGTVVTQSNASIKIAILAGPGDGVLSGTTTVNAVNGVATFNHLSLSQRGTYILTASNANILSGNAASFEITDPPAKLVFVPEPTNAIAGVPAYPFIGVNVEDELGAYVLTDTSTVKLSIASGPAGASLGGTTSVAAVNGVATFSNIIFSAPGTYTLQASDGMIPSTVSTSILVSPGNFQLQTLASLNGGFTVGTLIADPAGDLFGLTDGAVNSGGKSAGTIFEIPAGTHAVIPLASFPSGPETVPSGTLALDAQGDLFGTMELGGDNGTGSIFELPKGSSNIISIASFEGTNGSYPVSGLIADPAGNLYGTTYGGGNYNSGVVFEVPANTSTIQVLASIGGQSGGSTPLGGLYRDANGNLFGTTEYGGSFNAGTIFEVSASGVFKTLVSLAGPNGQNPTSALVGDANGNLYGTTDQGGTDGYGTLFEISNGHLTTLLNFTGGNGASPYSGLVADSHGNLFGTTLNADNQTGPGIIYELPHGSSSIVMLATFNGASEQLPYGGLTFGADGNLYGISDAGGSYGGGAVYELQVPSLSPTFSVNGGAVQRSMDKLLTFSFPQPVNLTPGAITLTQHATGGSFPMSFSMSSPDGGMTWNITFPSYVGISLPDGVYDLTLIASGVTSVATGMSMTGANQTFTFHRLFGDADGNGTVNQTDYSAFLSSYGQTMNSQLYNSIFDYDGNGIINGTDYLQFKLRFGESLLY